MKVTLIEFGKETESGRIYIQHQVSEVPQQVFCCLDHLVDKHGMANISPELSNDMTCGFANITVDEIGIHADIKQFSDARGKMYDELMMNGYRIAPLGTGSLNEKFEVQDYRLKYVYLKKD